MIDYYLYQQSWAQIQNPDQVSHLDVTQTLKDRVLRNSLHVGHGPVNTAGGPDALLSDEKRVRLFNKWRKRAGPELHQARILLLSYLQEQN